MFPAVVVMLLDELVAAGDRGRRPAGVARAAAGPGENLARHAGIAVQRTRAIRMALAGNESARPLERPTDNVEAYEAYRLGRERFADDSFRSLQEARQRPQW